MTTLNPPPKADNIRAAQLVADHAQRRIEKHAGESGVTIPCGKGCFWCCKEPVQTDRAEAQLIVDSLDDHQRAALIARVRLWLTKARQAGALLPTKVNAFSYRSHNLWCPLLSNGGQCTAYQLRPISCRLHIARDSVDGCKDDALRPSQKFATSPEMTQAVVALIVGGQSVSIENDHLGAHLARILLGEDVESGIRETLNITLE